MNITFLIGNGFDLNLGLKTSYQDFYNYYISKEPDDIIVKSITEKTSLWSDMEIALGSITKNLDIDKINEYFESKEKLEKNLIDYLKNENDKIIYQDKKVIAEDFCSKLSSIGSEFTPKEADFLKQYVTNNNVINYQFIVFNYTDIIDNIVDFINETKSSAQHLFNGQMKHDPIAKPLHIHGTLDNGLVIGVNDDSQIEGLVLKNDNVNKRFLIKKDVNEDYGNYNTQKAQNMINGSSYVCLYGLSFGVTDNMWWEQIIEWLMKDGGHRLVLYIWDKNVTQMSASSYNRYSRIKKENFFKNRGKTSKELNENVYNQTIVIINSHLFDIKGLTIKENISNG